MIRIDLDDLPPKVAATFEGLGQGEELVVVRGGVVVARLEVRSGAPLSGDEPFADLPPEERMKEVLDQFSAMIHDEF